LATQNPVDLDYKGLANIGTWFIGRLQTERDKARVLEGLEGASAQSGQQFDRSRMEQVLAGLGSRMFLLNNVHEDEPVMFESRWCLSYLRGPLTRTQIQTLMDPVKAGQGLGVKSKEKEDEKSSPHPSPFTPHRQRPMLPPDVPQFFVPLRGAKPDGTELVYAPMLLGSAQVRFSDTKRRIDATQDVTVLASITDGAMAVDWDQSSAAELVVDDVEHSPEDGAQFLPLPAVAGKAKHYAAWAKDFGGWLFRMHRLELLMSPSSKEVSKPGESERDFRVRLQQTGREQRDQAADALRRKYAPKIAALQEKLRRAGQQKDKQEAESRASQVQAAISVGASILGAFLGRKAISSANIGRATTAIRGAGRVLKENQDVGRAAENVAAVQGQLADLEAQFQAESEEMAAAIDPLHETFDTVVIKPTKADIAVKLVALVWLPHRQDRSGKMAQAWQ